jgi:hypothetical protein
MKISAVFQAKLSASQEFNTKRANEARRGGNSEDKFFASTEAGHYVGIENRSVLGLLRISVSE